MVKWKILDFLEMILIWWNEKLWTLWKWFWLGEMKNSGLAERILLLLNGFLETSTKKKSNNQTLKWFWSGEMKNFELAVPQKQKQEEKEFLCGVRHALKIPFNSVGLLKILSGFVNPLKCETVQLSAMIPSHH
jgi:hypothetical protein